VRGPKHVVKTGKTPVLEDTPCHTRIDETKLMFYKNISSCIFKHVFPINATPREDYSGAGKKIIAALTAKPNASQVARDTGWSFSTVWRVAKRAGIELTAGRATMGRERLSPERRAKVIETRRANPNAPTGTDRASSRCEPVDGVAD
jgi:hypothetical protein